MGFPDESMFKYHGWVRGEGATTRMVWDAVREACFNPDEKVILVFPYQIVIEVAKRLFPYPLPPNLYFTTISRRMYGVYGKVYIDGSVEKSRDNAEHFDHWSCVNAKSRSLLRKDT